MQKLSVVLAVRNEEKNIGECLASVKDIADEIVIFDEESEDKTREIAESFGAKVTVVKHSENFHITKEKAIEAASGNWILQLDADERVTSGLAAEIKKIIGMTDEEIETHQESLKKRKLFLRHQKIIEDRDGPIGKEGPYVGFFLPRLNYFLGKFLIYGGVYPDGVIRLFKRGKGRLPAKNVHEQMSLDGKVGWLGNDLIHMADPTFARYLKRNSYYIDWMVTEMKTEGVKKNILQFLSYMIVKPIWWFLLTQIRHKGILDGIQGIIFSFFSALRFPRAYLRYLKR